MSGLYGLNHQFLDSVGIMGMAPAGSGIEQKNGRRAVLEGKRGIPELLVVLAIARLVFGPGRLSALGKSLGEGIGGFRPAVND
jgi:TatA/E family protein of Tat protein translocase